MRADLKVSPYEEGARRGDLIASYYRMGLLPAFALRNSTSVIASVLRTLRALATTTAGVWPIMMSKMPESHLRDESKRTILAAAKGDEFASWYDEQRHSLFIYYFFNDLGGQADAVLVRYK